MPPLKAKPGDRYVYEGKVRLETDGWNHANVLLLDEEDPQLADRSRTLDSVLIDHFAETPPGPGLSSADLGEVHITIERLA